MSDYYFNIITQHNSTCHESIVTDETYFSHAEKNCIAIRENKKKETKIFEKPHPYPVGLAVMSNNIWKNLELRARHQRHKTK